MSHRLQILVPGALDARIRREAQQLRMSKGEWVRLAALQGPTADIEQMIDEIESGRS